MVSDLCNLDKVGWKETGIGTSHLRLELTVRFGGKKWEEGEEGSGGYWRQMGVWLTISPPTPLLPLLSISELSFNPASFLSRNLGFNREGAPRASTIALNSLELQLELEWWTVPASQASGI